MCKCLREEQAVVFGKHPNKTRDEDRYIEGCKDDYDSRIATSAVAVIFNPIVPHSAHRTGSGVDMTSARGLGEKSRIVAKATSTTELTARVRMMLQGTRVLASLTSSPIRVRQREILPQSCTYTCAEHCRHL